MSRNEFGNKSARSRAHLTLVQSMPLLLSSDDHETWWSYFERKYGRTQVTYAQAMETSYVRIWSELNKMADTWERDKQGLYDVFVVLFVMRLADRWMINRGDIDDYTQMAAYYFSRIETGCLERLTTVVQSLHGDLASMKYGTYLDGIASYMADSLLERPRDSAMPWFEVYKLLWTTVLNDQELQKRERVRLRQLAQNERLGTEQCKMAAMLLACLDFIAGDDENAWERITTSQAHVEVEAWFPYLADMASAQEWDRLQRWLLWLRPYMDSAYLSREMEIYLALWKELQGHADVESAYRETMVRLLPSSFWEYESFLMEKEDYRTWSDACVMLGLSPLHLGVEVLKRAEKADAKLLLPVYHHAIEKNIKAGNREAYKSVVKLLKKLGSLYKKLKETSRFEAYVKQLTEQYARHCALQEELKKGKLLI
ncbi:hypothetical protein [Paenibacillus roseipurpureus]|uniref:Uncharacterized protein n=1 Tax=Paenibacillus roseopurpureus TaxID=2918901 RepID=A0AA96LMT3_9BACL|nr:hypothetical protein [Paenibacillus sp. MBLB1832]WNR43889.1 hypothetical protein MJB10_22775 [Paenibacillus sp. MBLB1832]